MPSSVRQTGEVPQPALRGHSDGGMCLQPRAPRETVSRMACAYVRTVLPQPWARSATATGNTPQGVLLLTATL